MLLPLLLLLLPLPLLPLPLPLLPLPLPAATSVVVTPWAKIRKKSPHKQKPPSHPPAVPAPAPAYHR